MIARVAINGFGRVGRLCLRSTLERHKDRLSVVALNDLADLKTNAHLLQYDSSYGPFPYNVELGEGLLKMDGWDIRFDHRSQTIGRARRRWLIHRSARRKNGQSHRMVRQ